MLSTPEQPRQAPLPAQATFQQPTRLRIRQIETDNYRTKTFVLDGSLAGSPGQFVMAWLPRFDEKPFSLVNADPITLMVTAVGPFSRLMHEKKVGESVWVRGAFGHGYEAGAEGERMVLVGGGYGVAPLHWLARTQIGRAKSITAIIGARVGEDVLYHRRFEAMKAEAAKMGTVLNLVITTEDGSMGETGRVTVALEPLLARGEVDAIYACGPHGMLAALEGAGSAHGVATQLSWEAYMRCGIGICGSCEHKGRLLCMDGPVLTRA